MPTDHNIRQLIINKMTDAQYEQAVKNADELYLTPDTGGGGGGGSGTVTSVRVQATSPVVSSQNTEQTTTLNTTISLANNYGDTKNPYASKTKNYVLAAPVSANGTPSFRALDKADIPLASETAASGGTTTSLVTTGEKYTWNNKQDALPSQSGQSGKFLTTDGSSMSWADASVEIDNSTITENSNNEIQTVGIKDNRNGDTIKVWTGTKAQYDTFASPAWSTLTPALYERGGWGALAYGNGMFVSIGTYGYVSTSYDGTTWSDTEDSNLASQSYWYAITYDGSNFIALTSDGYISTSSDGTSWSAPTQVSNLGNNTWYNIVYDGSKLLALGYNGHISTSTDGGTTWTVATQISALNGKHWRGIVYTGTKFVSLSYEGYVSTSTNGTTWTTPVSATSALGSNNSWFNLAYNGSKFVAIGMYGYVSESIDGINWETATRPSSFYSNAFHTLAYGNSLFVTISSNSGYVSTRLDGANSNTLYNIKDYGLYLGSTEVANVSSGGDSLPDQTGQDGKFLTTDGTDASWATVDRVTSVVAGSSANKINVTKNGTTSTITVNNVANATNATNATSSNKTSGMYDKYYRAYAGAAISTYGLLMKGANGRLYPIVTPSYSTDSTKVVTTTGLRPDFIWLYDGNAAVSAGGVIKADVLYPEYGSTAGNKYLNSTVPTYCDIYLCGDYDATKDLFYLSTTDASGTASTTSFYALVPYNSEPTYSNYFIQGRYYIYLGSSYSTANYFQLKTQHPLYYFDGTQLVKVSKRLADLAGPKFLTFTNVSASTWVADNTYQDYDYKCVLTCNGVTSNDYAQVIFSPSDASSGNYANVCLTGTDTVTIYSKVNTSITILSIIILGA